MREGAGGGVEVFMFFILMCPPKYYGIEYEINPWMSRSRGADPSLAKKQWENLYNILERKLGLKISLLEPQPGVPDLVFTANAGLVSGSVFIPSNFRYPQRQKESPFFRQWFEKQGYEIRPLPENLYFEGEGDALFVGENLFAGYRIRSDIQTHALLGEILQREVLSLELVDSKFYHLDTCFCPLGPEAAAYYPAAFDPYGQRVIKTDVALKLEVSTLEALRFACNAVVVEKKVVLNTGCPELKKNLQTLGYEVWETDLSEFIKAGGSAKCLVLFLG